jgi:hypothetical protein
MYNMPISNILELIGECSICYEVRNVDEMLYDEYGNAICQNCYVELKEVNKMEEYLDDGFQTLEEAIEEEEEYWE